MQYKSFLCLALLGSSTAETLSSQPRVARLHPRDVQSLVNIKSSIKHGTEGVIGVENAIKAVTAANAKQQLATVNSLLTKLSSDVSADMKKLKASGTIGITEILGLLTESSRNELISTIGGLFTALNSTAFTVISKRDIIKDSGAVDVVVPGIKSLKQGLVDILAIVPSQVPSIAKGPIDNIVNSIVNGAAAKGAPPPAGAASAPPETLPALLRRQGGRGGTAKGSAPKSSAPKSTAAPKSPSGSSSGGGLENLLATPAAQERIGKGIDGILDHIIDWLRGTTEDLIPKEWMDAIAQGMPKGLPKGTAPPKAGGGVGAAPPSE
jgi:hypothetical protein